MSAPMQDPEAQDAEVELEMTRSEVVAALRSRLAGARSHEESYSELDSMRKYWHGLRVGFEIAIEMLERRAEP